MTENLDHIPESKLSRWAYSLALIPILGLPLYMILAIVAVIRIGSKGQTGFHLLRLGLFRGVRITLVSLLGLAALWFVPEYSYEKHYNTFSILCGEKCICDKSSFEFIMFNQRGYGYKIRTLPGKYIKVGTWTYGSCWDFSKLEQVYSFGTLRREIYWEKDGSRKVIMHLSRNEFYNLYPWYKNDYEFEKSLKYYDNTDERYLRKSIEYNSYGIKIYEGGGAGPTYAGIVKKWHDNGKLKLHEKWHYIEREFSKHYDENGSLTKEEFYDDNGKLIKTINYKDGKPI